MAEDGGDFGSASQNEREMNLIIPRHQFRYGTQ
jgi:hypothetical protein